MSFLPALLRSWVSCSHLLKVQLSLPSFHCPIPQQQLGPSDPTEPLQGALNSLMCFLFWQSWSWVAEISLMERTKWAVWGLHCISSLVSVCVSGPQGEQEPADPNYAAEIPPSGEFILFLLCLCRTQRCPRN